jgi:E3 ubiquitin-protein ligase RFWD2
VLLNVLWIQGIELPVKELDSLMHLLSEKKRKVEQEEAETNMEILLEFLTRSRQQKQEELNQVRRMQIVRIWWKL